MGPELKIKWEDWQGKTTHQTFFLSAGETVMQSIARANALRSALLSLSNARIVGAELIYHDVIESIGLAALNSNTAINLVCLFKDNNETVGSIRIPSPRPSLPYDAEGPWKGLRMTRASLVEQNAVQAIEDAISNTIFLWGAAFPSQFVVAGIDYTI